MVSVPLLIFKTTSTEPGDPIAVESPLNVIVFVSSVLKVLAGVDNGNPVTLLGPANGSSVNPPGLAEP
jgi:hypothetical protein